MYLFGSPGCGKSSLLRALASSSTADAATTHPSARASIDSASAADTPAGRSGGKGEAAGSGGGGAGWTIAAAPVHAESGAVHLLVLREFHEQATQR